MVIVVKALDGCFLDGSVHAFDLTVGPEVLYLRETMLNTVVVADPVEDMVESIPIGGAVGELDAVVSQDVMNCVRHCCDDIAQELGRVHLASFDGECSESELERSINCYKQIKLTFSGLNLGNIDVEITDRMAFELLLRLLVTSHLWQARNAVTLQAAMQ